MQLKLAAEVSHSLSCSPDLHDLRLLLLKYCCQLLQCWQFLHWCESFLHVLQAKLPETLAALAQSAPLPESRMGAVRLAEQLPTRAPEAVAVRFALLEAADASAALTAALSPPSPSHLLYMLQVQFALIPS